MEAGSGRTETARSDAVDPVDEEEALLKAQIAELKAANMRMHEETAKKQAELEAANAKPKGGKKGSPRGKGDKEKGAAAAEGGAPGEWKKCTSKSGKPFWYNKKTKKSVWKDPTT